jgi:hypothetical protein
LNAADRVALFIEQAMNSADERRIGRPIIAAVAGALQRAKLRESRLPIAQDMLLDAQLDRQLADGAESVFSLLCAGSHSKIALISCDDPVT